MMSFYQLVAGFLILGKPKYKVTLVHLLIGVFFIFAEITGEVCGSKKNQVSFKLKTLC